MQQLNTPIVTFRAFLLRSSISLAAASLLPAVGLGGCAPSRDVGNKTIVIGTTEDFESINELIAQGSSFNTAIVNRVLLKLLEEQADSQESPASFLGRLASSWAFSEDRLQLVCPCHDSEFDPADNGQVTDGPARRRLAALSLDIGDGRLIAGGSFLGRVGFLRR